MGMIMCKRLIIILYFLYFNFFSIILCAHKNSDINSLPVDGIDNATEFLWEYDNLGNGYSSPEINNNKVFITGEIDSLGFLFVLDMNGNLIWSKSYGKEWITSYNGSRATPTVIDNLVYVCSGLGNIVCFDVNTGDIVWSKNMISDLNGQNNVYGYSMKLICKNEVLYCFTGGKLSNVAALNRYNGDIIWISKGKGETAGYGDPILIEFPSRTLLVGFSEYSLLGLDANNGNLLWSLELSDYGEIPCNTPIYEEGYLYYVAGPVNGAAKIKLLDDGLKIETVWNNEIFDSHYSGFIKHGNYLFGTVEKDRSIASLDIKNGKIKHVSKIRKGSLIAKDDKLLIYGESGKITLGTVNEEKIEEVSSFRITKGSKEHFAHIVGYDDKMFVRHGNVLQVFRIK